MRKCECEMNKKGLEAFCVMEGVYGVLCLDCGALSCHGANEREAMRLWDEGELQREVGYFVDGSFEKEAIKFGRMLANVRL